MIDLLCDKNVLLELSVLSYKHENDEVGIIHSYHLQSINCQLFFFKFLTLCRFKVIVSE